MKKICFWFIKAFVAGVIAFFIISIFCFFYCNYPAHYTTPSKSTDYYWDKNALSIRGTEGFAFSRTDENGYVNTYPDKSDEIDILLMGSSHTEGFNVGETENYAYVLNELLNDNEQDMYAYNIGVSGHTLSRCFNNLDNAVSEFEPSKYIAIETTSLEIPLEDLQKLDDGTFDTLPSYDSGLIFFLQKSDFLRQMYSQFSNLMAQNNSNDTEIVVVDSDNAITDEKQKQDLSEYEIYLEKAIKKASDIAKQNDCELCITYIPQVQFDYEGKALDLQISEKGKLFESLCEEYDITLINMHSTFMEMYNETYILPQGFSNTAVGEGHINKYGHSEIAKELYRHITEEKK